MGHLYFKGWGGGELAPLAVISAEDNTGMEALIATVSSAVTETVNEIFRKHPPVRELCALADIVNLYGKRRKTVNTVHKASV